MSERETVIKVPPPGSNVPAGGTIEHRPSGLATFRSVWLRTIPENLISRQRTFAPLFLLFALVLAAAAGYTLATHHLAIMFVAWAFAAVLAVFGWLFSVMPATDEEVELERARIRARIAKLERRIP